MLHHEESPEKPQYNMATPPILPNPPFLAKIFRPPPIPINFEKVDPPPYEGGGVRTMRSGKVISCLLWISITFPN